MKFKRRKTQIEKTYVGTASYAMMQHAIRRYRERFNKTLSPREYMEICNIAKEATEVLKHQKFVINPYKKKPYSKFRQIKKITTTDGNECIAVYDVPTQLVVTFLTSTEEISS